MLIRYIIFFLALACCVPISVYAQSETVIDKNTIEFNVHIAPIFRRHCLSCHGPDEQSGGLRLDSREGAMNGGNSSAPLLSSDLDANELFQRVISKDPEYRMPRRAKGLSDVEIEFLRKWLLSGAVWPDPLSEQQPLWVRVGGWCEDYLLPWKYHVLLVLIGVALIERSRLMVRQEKPLTKGWLRPWFALVSWPSWAGIVALALFVSFVLLGRHSLEQRDEIVSLNERLGDSRHAERLRMFGDPPKPKRLNHPPRLHGTYYRGNCERNKKLFNGGHYLTAYLRIGLYDKNGKPLNVGDSVPSDGCVVRFEIERAPHATESLYTSRFMSRCFLSDQPVPPKDEFINKYVRVNEVKPLWKWAVDYPLPVPVADARDSKLAGVVYVDVCSEWDDSVTPAVPVNPVTHYGIGYEIDVKGGRIFQDSEIWLGAIFLPNVVQLPPSTGQLPHHHWLDVEPQPVIVGGNTKDPKLLGVDEHLKGKSQKP